MKLLVSVRDVDEALLAAAGGADFVDLKEPHDGALGALPLATIAAVVAALRARHPGRKISATVGDPGGLAFAALLERVAATAACGVDYVKVGLRPGDQATLAALAVTRATVVPVFVADHGLDAALIDAACAAPFPALMLDTEAKLGGSLLDRLGDAELARFVARSRAAGRLAGLAGALRADELPRLARLAPDFAGFRSAVCDGGRSGALSAARLQALRHRLQGASADAPAPLAAA